MPTTRQDTAYWLLGDPESLKFWTDDAQTDEEGRSIPPCPDMTGKMLPTHLQALKHIAYLKQDNPMKTIINIALETVATVEVYWRMGKIPTQEMTKGDRFKIKAAERLMNLWKKYLILKKSRDRQTGAVIKARADFQKLISQLYPLDHPNAKELIMEDEARTKADKEMDCNFLDDQYRARKMVMGEKDKVYLEAYLALQQGDQDQDVDNVPAENVAAKTVTVDEDDTSSSEEDDDDADPDFVSPKKKKLKPNYIEVLVPRKILSGEHVSQMADRTGLSYRKETGILGSILQDSMSSDGSPLDVSQFVLNKNSAHLARQKNRVEQERKFFDNFNPPKHTAFHWDEKFCKKVLGQEFSQGHIAMLVSGTNYDEGLLVGMSGLPNGEGMTVAKVCYDTMVQCKCMDNIRVLVWDTTNSNSGIHKGAAAILERDLLGRKLVWGACRKRIYDLLVRPV